MTRVGGRPLRVPKHKHDSCPHGLDAKWNKKVKVPTTWWAVGPRKSLSKLMRYENQADRTNLDKQNKRRDNKSPQRRREAGHAGRLEASETIPILLYVGTGETSMTPPGTPENERVEQKSSKKERGNTGRIPRGWFLGSNLSPSSFFWLVLTNTGMVSNTSGLQAASRSKIPS